MGGTPRFAHAIPPPASRVRGGDRIWPVVLGAPTTPGTLWSHFHFAAPPPPLSPSPALGSPFAVGKMVYPADV